MKSVFRKPLFWVGAAAITLGAAAFSKFERTNIAETSSDSKDANLQSRIYKFSGDLNLFKHHLESEIATLKTYGRNWNVKKSAIENSVITLNIEIPVVVFTDDLKLTIEKNDDEMTVNARSQSRVGQSDFGENRRHILQLFEKLDEIFDDSKDPNKKESTF